MDDLIKILQKLMSESPKPKGGIADTAEGIEFIGRKLTKDEIGGNAIIGSKLTDASRFKPFSIGNVGIENRYSLLREYGDDLSKKFEETIKFIKNNPDVRFSQVQKDNILYNLGVYRRVVAEKDKIARGLTEQGKNVDDIFNKRVDTLPNEMLTLEQSLEKFNKTIVDMGKKIKETEDIFKPEKVTDERKIRLKRLYDGPGYDRPNSSLYRGYGSFFLPKLHEKGIIKLDDQIYNNLKEGQHHWGGATYYAPDPIRIWRKHFGNEVFEKLDNFNPDGEDILDWVKRNNIEPVQKDGPKNALEYLTSTELQQNLADETSAFGKYKNPESAGDDAKYFYRDKPEQRMERITYHGENIGALEQALQTLDPDSYKEYFRTKPTYDSKVLPFKELNAEGGRVGFFKGAVASGENISPGTDVGGNVRDDNPFTGGGGNQNKVPLKKPNDLLTKIKLANPPDDSPFKKFAAHDQFTDFMKIMKVPNYHQMGGFDFMARFPNINPNIAKGLASAYQQITEMGKANPDPLGDYTDVMEAAQKKAAEETRLNIKGIDDFFDPTSETYKQYTNPASLLPTVPLANGGRVDFRDAGYVSAAYGGDSKKSTSSPSFDRPTMADVAGPVRLTPPRSIGPKPPITTIDIGDAPKIFDIDETGDPSLNPGSDNVTGGIDYRPSFTPPTFFEQALGTGQKIINNPFVRAGILKFLPPQFQTIGQFITLANSLKTAKNIYDETVKQSIDESLQTSFTDGLIPYDKVIEKEIEGDVSGPKPIDTESIIEKKLEGLIPEGTDLRTDAEKEADYFTNLKENYFPNRDIFNRFMMMDPDPKVEKDLLNLKNLDVQLTYPDQKVLNEQGYIDKEKLKSTVDQAEIVGKTNVGPFTFSRNIDTEGKGITSGSFDTKYLNIDSPNLEENQYSLTAKAPFENIDLSSTFNVQDGNVTDQRYDLNMDGLEGSYTIGDGFSTRNLELDKNFTVGNFDVGIDGMYSDYNSDDYNRYSSTFTPSVSYSQNIGDGILTSSIAKEMIQGGDVPNLSFAGSYPVMGGQLTGSLTNVLSDNMGATVGYDYKMGSPNLNNYLELKAKANPFNLRDSALYFGLKKEF